MVQKLNNRDGDTWNVEHHESERLSSIGGFLMTNRNRGRVTVSKRLPNDVKNRGRKSLLNKLADIAVGTSGTFLWHPDDD